MASKHGGIYSTTPQLGYLGGGVDAAVTMSQKVSGVSMAVTRLLNSATDR